MGKYLASKSYELAEKQFYRPRKGKRNHWTKVTKVKQHKSTTTTSTTTTTSSTDINSSQSSTSSHSSSDDDSYKTLTASDLESEISDTEIDNVATGVKATLKS